MVVVVVVVVAAGGECSIGLSIGLFSGGGGLVSSMKRFLLQRALLAGPLGGSG